MNLFKNILLTLMESFLTHGLEYFVTENILSHGHG